MWSDNPKCPGGPYLKATYDDYYDEAVGKRVPAFGFEAWCNMSGQFTFFVATGVPSVEVSICSVGVFGTRYIRASDPPSFITLDACTKILTVDHVHAEDAIGDTLAINLK